MKTGKELSDDYPANQVTLLTLNHNVMVTLPNVTNNINVTEC